MGRAPGLETLLSKSDRQRSLTDDSSSVEFPTSLVRGSAVSPEAGSSAFLRVGVDLREGSVFWCEGDTWGEGLREDGEWCVGEVWRATSVLRRDGLALLCAGKWWFLCEGEIRCETSALPSEEE